MSHYMLGNLIFRQISDFTMVYRVDPTHEYYFFGDSNNITFSLKKPCSLSPLPDSYYVLMRTSC